MADGRRASAAAHDDPGRRADDRPTELERVVALARQPHRPRRRTRMRLRKVFPDHWSFLLGEVALFCFVILVATGTFLTFFFMPDARARRSTTGPYAPLHGGQPMSAAYDSVMRLSFEVQAGLLMRQIHHWTALVFVGAIAVHLARVFFTGAFRRPREINWLIGFGLLLLALGEGITGYSLPGRPPVRDGAPDHRLGHAVDPVRRPVGRVAVLRRRVPDARHPSAGSS